MSEIIYPTKKKINGPWLLDIKKLQFLDKVFDGIWEKLTEYRSEKIEKEISSKIELAKVKAIEITREQIQQDVLSNYKYSNYYRILNIYFKSGKKLITTSFKDAAMQNEFENDIAENFEYSVKCLDIEASYGNNSYNSNEFAYSVKTFSSSLEKEIYYDIERWAKDNSPKFILRVWNTASNFVFPFIGVVAIIFSLLLIWAIQIPVSNNEDNFRKESYKILENGIDSSEVLKSIELLLSIESGYKKNTLNKTTSGEISTTTIIYFLSFTLLVLIIRLAPNTTIGLGKGEKKINRISIWIKIVTYIIPVLIILPILLAKISEYL